MHEHHASRDHAPRNHDASDPHTRSHPQQNQVAGKVEECRPQKKYSRPSPIHRIAEVKIALHIHRGKSHIHAIQIRHDIQQKHIRNQPPRDLRIQRPSIHRLRLDHPCSTARFLSFRWASTATRISSRNSPPNPTHIPSNATTPSTVTHTGVVFPIK